MAAKQIPVRRGRGFGPSAFVDDEDVARVAGYSWVSSHDDPRPRTKAGVFLCELLYPGSDLMFANGDCCDLRRDNVLELRKVVAA